MDINYDTDKACKKLDEFSTTRSKGPDSGHQLSEFALNLAFQQYVKIYKYDNPTTWRLISEHDVAEEVVLRIQGVLALKDLPPLTKKPSDPHKAMHLRQSVQLVGLGTDTFQRAIESIVHIHTMFSRQFKDGVLETWQPSAFGPAQAIDMSNRYFSSRRQNTQVSSIPFHEHVDPDGYLSELAGADLVHCDENQVRYYELLPPEGETDERYAAMDPTKFKIGDIVEAQVSFVGVPLKGGKAKMMLVLRALSLLDCQQSMQAQRERTKLTFTSGETKVFSLKRKVGYGQEDRAVVDARYKFQSMRVDSI